MKNKQNKQVCIKVLFVIFCLGISQLAFAQIGFEITQAFNLQVKTIDQFIGRFNYEQDIDNKKILKMDTLLRRKYLTNLFDLDNLKKLNKPQNKVIADFMKNVISKSLLLNYNDSLWYVQVNFEIDYKGKKQIVKVTLQNEFLNNANTWVIVGVEESFCKLLNLKKSNKAYLPVSSVEVNFMDLKQKTKDTTNTISYFDNSIKLDALTAFFMAWQQGDLYISAIKDIELHFLQIKGYSFRVKNHSRLTNNSGWLITDLQTLDALSLPVYKTKILFLK